MDYIVAGENYDPDGLTDALETFCRELEEALADYPQLKVSFGSSQAVLTGEANDRSGPDRGLACGACLAGLCRGACRGRERL